MTAVHESDAIETTTVRTYVAATLEEAVEMVRAAEVLGFGIQLRNYEVREDDDQSAQEWALELFDEVPTEDPTAVAE